MAYKTQLSPQYTSPISPTSAWLVLPLKLTPPLPALSSAAAYMYFTSSSQLSPGATGCMRNRNVGHSPAGPCCEDTKTTSLDTFCVPCLSVGLAGKGQAFLHLLRSYMQKSPHSNRPNREREGFMSSSQTGDRFSMYFKSPPPTGYSRTVPHGSNNESQGKRDEQ
ncbi:hypothetical protein ACO22_07459 [Paracoccidioides brasiliensis]|uniref:Uncharacterized protein n=1 Tax=Paracoccidioides brasiliensis TaxID=121759 RepID=A0A1D2J4N1_PARBR|nr:hypothetical protein ACO22_07459 [Paracoccidioides brasiliensis]